MYSFTGVYVHGYGCMIDAVIGLLLSRRDMGAHTFLHPLDRLRFHKVVRASPVVFGMEFRRMSHSACDALISELFVRNVTAMWLLLNEVVETLDAKLARALPT